MNYCNVNIKYTGRPTHTYAVGYDTTDNIINSDIDYFIIGDEVYLFGQNNYHRNVNEWNPITDAEMRYIDVNTKLSNISILFPLYSIETYDINIKYAVNVFIMIGNKKVNLYSNIISRVDSLAYPNVLNMYNNIYMEYIKANILDPLDIMYSKDWQWFREEVCECINPNREGCLLCISIFPVESDGYSYYIKNGYTEGQNVINMIDKNINMSLHISHNIFETDPSKIKCEVLYNKYEDTLLDYIKSNYNINNISIEYELVIKDNINKQPLKILTKQSIESIEEFSIEELYLPSHDSSGNIINYSSGLSIVASLNIYNNDSGEDIIYLISNEIPLTDNILGFFIEKDLNYINLQDITNMNVYNINTVNKTVNNVVKFNNIENSKSNLIQPIFFRTEKLYNIAIHPDVTENICINLDSYKSKVDYFLIKIEGISFNEIGRTNAGVIFKIQGNQLPQSITSGTYYIIDQDSNVITNGKYNYEY